MYSVVVAFVIVAAELIVAFDVVVVVVVILPVVFVIVLVSATIITKTPLRNQVTTDKRIGCEPDGNCGCCRRWENERHESFRLDRKSGRTSRKPSL